MNRVIASLYKTPFDIVKIGEIKNEKVNAVGRNHINVYEAHVRCTIEHSVTHKQYNVTIKMTDIAEPLKNGQDFVDYLQPYNWTIEKVNDKNIPEITAEEFMQKPGTWDGIVMSNGIVFQDNFFYRVKDFYFIVPIAETVKNLKLLHKQGFVDDKEFHYLTNALYSIYVHKDKEAEMMFDDKEIERER
jgi:hypothetical protein